MSDDADADWGARQLKLGLGYALAILIIDQVHKWWMIEIYEIAEKGRVVVAPFMNLVYVINKGISYGLFTQGDQTGQYILSAFAVIVSAALFMWLWRGQHTKIAVVAIGLIIGGAIANAIDRLHLGGVADFFDFHINGLHGYVFNIADVAIVVGVLGLMYDSFALSRTGAVKRP